jgi:CRISPR/Cas system-associated endonuclease/helicase Cas3
LAYNIPEIKLARAMTSVQKSVMLIIKAFQKTSLEEYSEELTTFHWKTAIYWESECVDHSLFETRTEENIRKFLHNVLMRMINSLREGNLEHYFVPSNLFTGKKEDAMLKIAAKVAEIQNDPVGVLSMFFIRQTANELKVEFIPRDKVNELLTNYYDEGDYLLVKTLISLLRGFSIEDPVVVRKALTHVLTEGLSFFIEEEARGRNRDNIDQSSHVIQSLLGIDVLKCNLIKSCVSLFMNQTYDEGEMDINEISRNFFILVLERALSGNC